MLALTSTLMITFIGVTLNYPLIKYGKALIYLSFHEDKHQDFVSFRESKHKDFVNLDEAILWKLKGIISYEGLHIASHKNDNRSWYNFIVKWGTGGV